MVALSSVAAFAGWVAGGILSSVALSALNSGFAAFVAPVIRASCGFQPATSFSSTCAQSPLNNHKNAISPCCKVALVEQTHTRCWTAALTTAGQRLVLSKALY